MDPEFTAKLKAAFKEEATEHLQDISSALLSIEKSDNEAPGEIEKLLRIYHSLKGSSRAVNLNQLEKTCQLIETLLIKYKDVRLPEKALKTIYEAMDKVDNIVNNLENEDNDDSSLVSSIETIKSLIEDDHDTRITILPESQDQDKEPEEITDENETIRARDKLSNSIRLPVDKLENFVKLSEELVYGKLASEQRVSELEEIQSILSQWSRRWQRLRPQVENMVQDVNKVNSTNRLTELKEFVDVHDSFISKMNETLNSIEKTVGSDKNTFDTLIDSLLDRGRELTMVPFEVMNKKLERIAWDISKEQDKEVNLRIYGSDVQIDRNILDELSDPIVHLIRNCIDHGIETREERKNSGKEQTANLSIKLEPIGSGKVCIEVADDGRGVDLEKVKRVALEKNIVKEDSLNTMDPELIYDFLFRSAFSTREKVSSISGRGLGLAIVKENVQKLNGTVRVNSTSGKETKFTITVPVRRATMVGITAKIGSQTVVIPTISIKSAVRLKDQDVRQLQGRWTLSYNDRLLPIVRLADILELNSESSLEDSVALIVGSSEYPIALTVEEVAGEQEVAVKNLPNPLTKVRNIAGATQLKTGDLAVVINMNEVLSSPYLVGTLAGSVDQSDQSYTKAPQSKIVRKKRVLVVEDSITSRVLLKNILETAGYEVSVASDGMDGFDKFEKAQFDIVITDVEMPRMNGFELTSKIRQESENQSVPIIVVTSLASLEDRKKGVQVGASAYFVKSNFEKSNLLDMVKRLV